jgi:hypothetical protein
MDKQQNYLNDESLKRLEKLKMEYQQQILAS